MRKRCALLLLSLAHLPAVGALAQSWTGSEALGIQASDSKGRPIANAVVLLEFKAAGRGVGPPSVATDSKGRAVITKLSPGTWQLQVEHPEYLAYVAVLDLVRGKKPKVSASFLQAGGGSLTPMKVKLSKAQGQKASVPLPLSASEVPGPLGEEKPVPVESTTPTAEPSPSPVLTPTPAATPTPPPSPPPTHEPTQKPTVQPQLLDEQPSEKPEEALAEEPAVEQPVAAPTAPATVPTPVPTPAPPQPVTPEPEALPDPEPTAPPLVPSQAASAPPSTADQPIERIETPPVTAPAGRDSAPDPVKSPEVLEQPLPDEDAALPEPAELPGSLEIPTTQEAPETPETPEKSPATEVEPVQEPSRPAPSEAAPEPAQLPAATIDSAAGAPVDNRAGVRSQRDQECAECEAGEWAVSASEVASATATPVECAAGMASDARSAMQALSTSYQLELANWAGPVVGTTDGDGVKVAEAEVADEVHRLMSRWTGTSPCRVIALTVPKRARISRVVLEAFDASGGGPCATGQECSVGRARWLGSPTVENGPSTTVVYAIFRNDSPDKERRARLTAYFRPPSSRWRPTTAVPGG